MSYSKFNNKTGLIEEVVPLPETEIVPPGIISSHDELENMAVDEADVDDMRDYSIDLEL
ncbi:MAG: hypothetical protein RSE36_08325 [Oscillospiraceae bacterium]